MPLVCNVREPTCDDFFYTKYSLHAPISNVEAHTKKHKL